MRARTVPAAVVFACVASTAGEIALAETPGAQRLAVPIDTTVEVDVGYAIGYACDDPGLVRVEMKTSAARKTNVFAVTGVKQGATLCRVGTDPLKPSLLFDVRVVRLVKRS